jgi:hypothetical protein
MQTGALRQQRRHAAPLTCHSSRLEQVQFELTVPQFYDLLAALETAQHAV